MANLIGSPLRNLAAIVAFLLAVTATATLAYAAAGWSLADAFYMVVLTVYTVGFRELHPVDTPYLRGVTIALMFLGCTGMILMTGALVQLFAATEIRKLMGSNRVKSDIDRQRDHTIICGFGRIGGMLARELADAGAPFVVIERDPRRLEEARRLGFLAIEADATDEAALGTAGVERARSLATVLPDDASNVFITLSARSLNRSLQIIARGEAASTERKLVHAGADKVILPTHIGAERIAELILHPVSARLVQGSARARNLERALRGIGLEIEVVNASEHKGVAGQTVGALEGRAAGAFLVAQIDRPGCEPMVAPAPETTIQSGDGLVIVGRSVGAFCAVFARSG